MQILRNRLMETPQGFAVALAALQQARAKKGTRMNARNQTMKTTLKNKALMTFAMVAGLGLSAQAATVTWGTWTNVTDNTAIKTLGGYTTYGGVNFNGSTTTISNGVMDVVFTGIAWKGSGTAAGITVTNYSFGFSSTSSGNSSVISSVGSPQTWGTVLDRVIGGAPGTITLSGLTSGSSYYVQFFSSAPDANILADSKITSGGVDSPFFGNHTSGQTRYIIATFTADGTSQSFVVSGTEPTYSALVIGVQPAGGGATPTIYASGTLTNFVTTNGTASAAQSISVTGSNLTASITNTAPTGFEVSTNGSAYAGAVYFPQDGSSNASGTLYVRLAAATAAGTYTGNVALASAGAATNIVATGTVYYSGTDTTPPTPDPMTFAVAPAVLDPTSMVMTATTATDDYSPPVQYYFENTNTSANSGWITSTVWTNTGWTAGVTYGYRVKARDSASTPNETGWSTVATATPTWIFNGGFELPATGAGGSDATGWVKENAWGREPPGNGYNSTYAYNSGGGATAGFYQTLGTALVAGHQYRLTFWLGTWAAGNQMRVRVGKYIGGNHYNDGSYSPLALSVIVTNATGAWTAFTNTFIASGGEDTLYLGATNIQPGDPGGKYDDVILTDLGPLLPDTPTGLTATAGVGQVSLAWTASALATGYKVWTSNSVTSAVAIDTTAATAHVKTGLDNGTLYFFMVAATNVAGDSAYSDPVSATPLEPFAYWQTIYFGSTTNPLAAADADPYGKGMSNTNQFLADLVPTNTASRLAILSVSPTNATDAKITWIGGGSNACQILLSNPQLTNSAAWTPMATNVPTMDAAAAAGVATNYIDSGALTNNYLFYRLRAYRP